MKCTKSIHINITDAQTIFLYQPLMIIRIIRFIKIKKELLIKNC